MEVQQRQRSFLFPYQAPQHLHKFHQVSVQEPGLLLQAWEVSLVKYLTFHLLVLSHQCAKIKDREFLP